MSILDMYANTAIENVDEIKAISGDLSEIDDPTEYMLLQKLASKMNKDKLVKLKFILEQVISNDARTKNLDISNINLDSTNFDAKFENEYLEYYFNQLETINLLLNFNKTDK